MKDLPCLFFFKWLLAVVTIFHIIIFPTHCFDRDPPGNTISNPPHSEEYVLSSDFKINNLSVKRQYTFTVTNTTAALDGFSRPVLAINNQIPGPLIEANEGDQMEITVINRMEIGLTIHWHGLFQNGTNWEDGVTGVTQCPIPPRGGRYTYRFNLTGQFGTFWYHAHQQNLMADGISGPFIIHSVRDPLKRSFDFDQEVVLMMADWYHNTSETILKNMLTEEGYFGTPAAPSPNSALINGIGQWDCKFATVNEQCSQIDIPPKFTFTAGETIRFRLINAGSHAMFFYSVDEHPLNVIEADGTGVYGPKDIHRVKFHNGQRYSVTIKTKKKDAGKNFYMRALMDTDCFSWVANDCQPTALGIISLNAPGEGQDYLAPSSPPHSVDWKDALGGDCNDLDPSTLVPILKSRVPEKVAGSGTFANAFGFHVIATGEMIPRSAVARNQTAQVNVSRNATGDEGSSPKAERRQVKLTQEGDLPLGKSLTPAGITVLGGPPPTPVGTIGKFFVNNITWQTFPFLPILHDLTATGSGKVNETRVAHVVFSEAEWYDLYLVNIDPGLSHPYHLHAMDMHVVGGGKGLPTPENLSNITFNTQNPLRRDTIVIDAASFMVVRVLADIPGAWIMHCHIGWHLAGGFAGVVVVQPEKIKAFEIPHDNLALCDSRVGPADAVEPGRLQTRNRLTRRAIDLRSYQ